MKLILVAGARPNFVKVAPIVEELAQRRPEIDAAGETLELLLVHTGQHLFLSLLSFFLAFLLTPLVRRAAFWIGAIDRPDERKVHRRPIARLGGGGHRGLLLLHFPRRNHG